MEWSWVTFPRDGPNLAAVIAIAHASRNEAADEDSERELDQKIADHCALLCRQLGQNLQPSKAPFRAHNFRRKMFLMFPSRTSFLGVRAQFNGLEKNIPALNDHFVRHYQLAVLELKQCLRSTRRHVGKMSKAALVPAYFFSRHVHA